VFQEGLQTGHLALDDGGVIVRYGIVMRSALLKWGKELALCAGFQDCPVTVLAAATASKRAAKRRMAGIIAEA